MTERRVVLAENGDDLARLAAGWLLEQANAGQGPEAISLSGGSTPRTLYERLIHPPILADFPWDRVHWFWGDERFVAKEDARSNYRMAQDAFLSHAPAPLANIHPIPTTGITEAAAAALYEEELRRFYGAKELDPGRPLFSVTLLGLGPDGHTASLFPGNEVLQEGRTWAAPVFGEQTEPRITLTYPVLASSKSVAFLVQGEEKRDALRGLLADDPSVPAARVRAAGQIVIFADRAAFAG